VDSETDAAGAFSFELPRAGDYLIDVEREGYYQFRNRTVDLENTQVRTRFFGRARAK